MTMNSTRTYVAGALGALVFFVVANLLLYWFLVRPTAHPTNFDTGAVAAAQAAAADTAAPAGPGTATGLVPLNGQWQQTSGTYVQTQNDATDFAAGLNWQGTEYTISADILGAPAQEESGGGFFIHMAAANTPRDSYMVRLRFLGASGEVIWGAYDSNGVFQGVGGAAIPLLEGMANTLKLAVHGNKFDVYVNGQEIAIGLPLQRTSGNAGLAAFRGPVEFTNVVITAL